MGYGIFTVGTRAQPRSVGFRLGDAVLDLGRLSAADAAPYPELLRASSLDGLLAAGRPAWRELHGWLAEQLAEPDRLVRWLRPLGGVHPVLPFTVADFVDFYSSEQHATNAGRILRPDGEALAANWRHLPVGYHGRAGSVVVSGTPIIRPSGPRGKRDFGPTAGLDFEAEIGYVLGGGPTEPGEPVPMSRALDHVFGVVLLNDWSARDIQAWESRPLGPMLGKSFATSISPWVVPLDDLAGAWVAPPAREPEPLPYLRGEADRGLDIVLEARLDGEVISRPPAGGLYWTPAQLVAHLTCNGAPLRPGDLLGSGTVSGPECGQRGCLLELSWGGAQPLRLADGTELCYLRDGDELSISGSAAGVDLGTVSGRILPARAR